MSHTLRWTAAALMVGALGTALAKLPAASDEAKAKAAEAAAKTAHGNKVADFLLCKSMNRVADGYREAAKKAGKETKPATGTPECADPGAFVYTPPGAASAPATAAAAVASAPATVAAAAGAKPAAAGAKPSK